MSVGSLAVNRLPRSVVDPELSRAVSGDFQLELSVTEGLPRVVKRSRAPDAVTAGGGQLYWCGELHDTVSLCQQLKLPCDAEAPAIAIAALERKGREAFRQLRGRWALAWLDPDGTVLLARDPMGGEALFWADLPSGYLVATQWEGLFADPRWDRSEDYENTAAFFSVFLSPTAGGTFQQGLHLLPPGAVARLERHTVKCQRYWDPLSGTCWVGSEADAQKEYRHRLKQSIEAAVHSAKSPAILLSSGLDSGSIAAMASHCAQPLRALSWSIESVPEVDESHWIKALASKLRLPLEVVAVDGIWPLHPIENHRPADLGPLSPPFGGLRNPLYHRASEGGSDVVLTGDGGDALFAGSESWLLSLALTGQWPAAFRGIRSVHQSGRLRNTLTNQIKATVPESIKRLRPVKPPPWLTDEAQSLLCHRFDELRVYGSHRRLSAMTSGWADLQEVALAPRLARIGLRIRHPLRDQRMAEFMLRLPPHWLHQPGESKRLLRRAMYGALPESDRTAPRRGSLFPLARRFLTNSLDVVRSTLHSNQSQWQRWVRSDWMDAALLDLPKINRDGPEWLVVWNCVAYELWKQREPDSALRH
ncbi:MAG: hypothetical protein KDI51_03250 [Xanthomonadales bacterium]|nr:hypothetical protein [Xanthomonadales bacterium]